MRIIEKMIGESASLTCYLQDHRLEIPASKSRPAVLICHGGGYINCCERETEPVALAFLNEGFQAFVLRYALWKRNEQTLRETIAAAYEDSRTALAWIRMNAEEFHIDRNHIVAAGFSAGGNLAAGLGYLSDETSRPDALILGYGDYQIEDEHGDLLHPDILQAVDSAAPPTFLFATQGDTIVPCSQSLKLCMSLYDAGVPFENHIFLKGNHGLSTATRNSSDDNTENPDVAQWVPMSIRFLRNMWEKEEDHSQVLSADRKISDIMKNDKAEAVLAQYLPGMTEKLKASEKAQNITLRTAMRYANIPDAEHLISQINTAFRKL